MTSAHAGNLGHAGRGVERFQGATRLHLQEALTRPEMSGMHV